MRGFKIFGVVVCLYLAWVCSGQAVAEVRRLPVPTSTAAGMNDACQIVGWVAYGDGFRAVRWDQGIMHDLSSLTGDLSFANGINNKGQVVGTYHPGDGHVPHAFMIDNGKLTDLGSVPGVSGGSHAYGINLAGQVVGEDGAGAVLWQNGTAQHLPSLPGSIGSVAYGINNNGSVVGAFTDIGGGRQPALWQGGVATTLGIFDGTAVAINDAGQVVGSFVDTLGPRAFVWQSGHLDILLGFSPSDATRAFGINAAGQVVGLSGNEIVTAVKWTNGNIENLGNLQGSDGGFGIATAINGSGQIAGISTADGGIDEHAFLFTDHMTDLSPRPTAYSEAFGVNVVHAAGVQQTETGLLRAILFTGSPIDLGTLGGSESCARSINATGSVVGYSRTSDALTHAFLWIPAVSNGLAGSMSDLTPGKSAYSAAYSINSPGQVAGCYSAPNGKRHAALWQPPTRGGRPRIVDLTPGSISSIARAVNDGGWVVGEQSNSAFVWQPLSPNSSEGHLKLLPSLGGKHSTAYSISASGVVAGCAELAKGSSHAVLWRSGKPLDIGTLGGLNSCATAVTDSSDGSQVVVVGWSETLTGDVHAFSWDPIYGLVDISHAYNWILTSANAIVGEPANFLAAGAGLIDGQINAYELRVGGPLGRGIGSVVFQ